MILHLGALTQASRFSIATPPCWTTAVFSAILRVPISFPPERFRGVSLSAMSVPDLRGTQGSFTLYSSEGDRERDPRSPFVSVGHTLAGTILS